jgi:hypothetical protein
VTESDTPYVRADPVEYRPALRGGVSSTSLACHCVWRWQPLRKSGYSVSFVGRADPNRPVTLSLNNMDFENAAKEIAFTAGYVAVLDRASRQINIAEEATSPSSWTLNRWKHVLTITRPVPFTAPVADPVVALQVALVVAPVPLVVPVVQVARRARPPVRW